MSLLLNRRVGLKEQIWEISTLPNPCYIEKAEERISKVEPEKTQENRSDLESKTTEGGGTK